MSSELQNDEQLPVSFFIREEVDLEPYNSETACPRCDSTNVGTTFHPSESISLVFGCPHCLFPGSQEHMYRVCSHCLGSFFQAPLG